MPLAPTIIDVPFSGGLQQKSDSRYVTNGMQTTLLNARKQKEHVFSKRFGHTALSTGVCNTSGQAGASIGSVSVGGPYSGVPWVIGTVPGGGGDAHQYLSTFSETASAWTVADRVPEVTIRDRIGIASPSVNASIGINNQGVAYGTGYLVTIFTADLTNIGTAQCYYSVISASTQAVVVPVQIVDPSLTSCNGPRIITVGNTAVLVYGKGSPANLYLRHLDLTQPWLGWSPEVNLVTTGANYTGYGAFDIASIPGDITHFAIAHEINAGGKSVTIRKFDLNYNEVETYTLETQGNYNTFLSVALCANTNEQFWVAYTASQGASLPGGSNGVIRVGAGIDGTSSTVTPVTVFNFDNGSGYAPATLSDVTRQSGSQCYVTFTQGNGSLAGGANPPWVRSQAVSNVAGAATLQGAMRYIPNVALGSKLFQANGIAYVFVYTPSKLQGTWMLAALDWWGDTTSANPYPGRQVGTFSPRLSKAPWVQNTPQGSGDTQSLPTPVNVAALTASTWVAPSSLSLDATGLRNEVVLNVCDVGNSYVETAAQLGTMLAISSATPSRFDGAQCVEMGYNTYEEGLALTTSAAGGSMHTGAGTDKYNYIVVYEWTDNQGNVDRGATGVAALADMSGLGAGSSGSVALVIHTLGLTKRRQSAQNQAGTTANQQAKLMIRIYRTTGGGTTYYSLIAKANDVTVPTITYTDGLSDAGLTSASGVQLLYTTGGALDNFQPAAARNAIVHKNRLWLSGCDDPTQIWPSKELVPGEAPGFNEALNITATGAVRAKQSLDDKLIAFVQRGQMQYGIEYIVGDGPFDTGANNNWSTPQSIPADCGAVDQRATCSGPFGVLFRSLVGGPLAMGGIFLLTRDLQVQYVGAPVEDQLTLTPVVTSMLVHPSAGRVYITCVDSDSAPNTGVRLVYDYTMGGIWSIDKLLDGGVTAQAPRAEWVANTAAFGINKPSPGQSVYWASPAGQVYRENNGLGANAYTDGSKFVSMQVATAWIKPNLQGRARFWKVRFKGQRVDAHDLTMQLLFDDAPSYSYQESYTWSDAAIVTFDRLPEVQVMMTPLNQEAQSIQVVLSDATPTGGGSIVSGAGFSAVALSLEMGVDTQRGFRNLPAAQRA